MEEEDDNMIQGEVPRLKCEGTEEGVIFFNTAEFQFY